MKFSYYPGCTLKTKGKDLDRYGRLAAEALGFELCQDLWAPCPPSVELAAAGATIIGNLSASSDIIGKDTDTGLHYLI